MTQNEFLRGQRISPKPVTGKETVADLVDNAFLAYNAGRLGEACRLFAERMLEGAKLCDAATARNLQSPSHSTMATQTTMSMLFLCWKDTECPPHFS